MTSKIPHRHGAYDNSYAPDNVYGHAVELLRRHRVGSSGAALHIDVGCGYGRIAEPLAEALHVTYIGCDLDEGGLASLAVRGFETHKLVLSTEESIYEALTKIIAGRQLASVSIIDTLEHLDDPAATMRALCRVAAENKSFVLVSVPNTAHRDLGLRLLFGEWDYTETGILDHTHRVLFSDSVLRRMLSQSGLYIVDSHDVEIVDSDQAFPTDHPVFQPTTHLHKLLGSLRGLGDTFGSTNQLVRLCAVGPMQETQPYLIRNDHDRPFLSIVIRTQGTRNDALSEVLLCLAGQTVTDFEILIVGHKLDLPRQIGVEQVIEDLPLWLCNKTRLIRVQQGDRTRPLNVGFSVAEGRYIVILDDDDTVFGHWVESFQKAAKASPGQILRSVSAVQSMRRVEYNFVRGLRSETALEFPYPSTFDWFEHLRVNRSPGMTLAFPRGLFHHLKIAFDESLTTTEDWDYLLRTASLVGVASTTEITAIYRKWINEENSYSVHKQEEWDQNMARVWAKIDNSHAVLWPVGSTKRLRRALDDIEILEARADCLIQPEQVAAERQRLSALQDVTNIYFSSSWRFTAPLRFLTGIFGRRPLRPAEMWSLSTPDLLGLAVNLRNSRSWRLSGYFRRFIVKRAKH